MTIKNVVVANDIEANHQAMYVNGKLVASDSTIYAHDIEHAVGGKHEPFTLEQIDYEELAIEEWPKNLSDLPTKE